MAHNIKSLADILVIEEKFIEAREMYEEALNLHLDDGDEVWAAAVRWGIGESFLREGNPEEAEEIFEEVLEAERGMDYGRGVAYDLKLLADACSQRQDYGRAGGLISESRDLSRLKDMRGELDLQRIDGLYHQRTGDRNMANQMFSLAREEAKKRGYLLIAGIIEKDMENI